MFDDRKDAGRKLAAALADYKDKDVLVLAIPKGGIEVGYEVAKELSSDFSVLISRKLPYPDNPEAGFGAIAEDGSTYMLEQAALWVAEEAIDEIIKEQKREIERRMAVLRRGLPLPEIEGRTVILVDDGIAMGSTMRASIMLCRNLKAREVIVAVPVTGTRVAGEIGEAADRIIVLKTPPGFRAVAQVYRHWHDVSDAEAIEILDRWIEHRQ